VALRLVDHRRGSADKYSWLPPFDWAVAYENEQCPYNPSASWPMICWCNSSARACT